MARNPVIFENGTLIQNAKVEIDGVIYDVQPAQFDGSTPLSANNLNRAQTNLYDYVDEKSNEKTEEINDAISTLTDNIYVKGNFVKLSGSVSIARGGTESINLTLPSGFTQNNSFVIGYQWRVGSSRPIISGNNFESGSGKRNNYIAIYYNSNTNLRVTFYNNISSTQTYYVDVLLLKIN
jgi:hypothetical protein